MGNTVTSGIKVGSKQLTKMSKDVKMYALKNDFGGKIEAIKKVIPQSVVEASMSTALIAAGVSPDEANILAGASVGAAYNVDFGEDLDGQGNDAVQGGVQGGFNAAVTGCSVKIRSKLNSVPR